MTDTLRLGPWVRDVLGSGFEARTIFLQPDAEGEVTATLVRYAPASDEETARPKTTTLARWRWWEPRTPPPPAPANLVLYLHGWNDYFFHRELAEFWHRQGAHFYALDLRKYGRSLLEHQTPGYIDDLAIYDEEIAAALAIMRTAHPGGSRIMLLGHSTGGLIASLWANRHPGELSSLVLNSPWLELQGSTLVRSAAAPIVKGLAKIDPLHSYPNIDLGFNSRTIRGFEWDERWRPTPSFPVRRGWLSAIMAGHSEVASGLDIQCPVLVLTAERSLISPVWSQDMMSADVVLDVQVVWQRSARLAKCLTLVKIPDGLHDLALSPPAPREKYYRALSRWSRAFGWSDPSSQ